MLLPLSILATPAAACTCIMTLEPDIHPYGDNVPLNVRPLVRFQGKEQPLSLQTASGTPVPFTQRTIMTEGRPIVEVLPDAHLAPETTYTLSTSEHQASFTTGTGTDEQPPTGGELESWHWGGVYLDADENDLIYIPDCSGTGVFLKHTPTPDDSAVLQALVSPDADFSAPTAITWLPHETTLIGKKMCPVGNFPDLTPGEDLYFKTRYRDVAGNTTAWSDPVHFRPGYRPYSGHTDPPSTWLHTIGALVGAFLALLALAVTVLAHRLRSRPERRRRRPTRTR